MADRPVSTSAAYLTPMAGSDAWTLEAAGRGGRGAQVLREVCELDPPAEVVAALVIASSESVVVRRRTILFNDEPVELADSYYPGSIARGTGLAGPTKIRGGAPTLLASLDLPMTSARERVSARQPTPVERRLLRLPEADWVLVQERVSFTDGLRPIEFSIMVMPAISRSLTYEVTS
jgi:GntR family transcriptional regulator